MRADLKNRVWGEQALTKLRKWGGRVFGYVRVGHYNYKAVPGDGYEWVCKMLIEHAGAGPLRHFNGEIMNHKDRYGNWYDAYTIPWLLPLRPLAEVTAKLAYDKECYQGLLLDGLNSWLISAPDPEHADYKQLTGLYMQIAQKQFSVFETFVQLLRAMIPKVKLVGNGSWEPSFVHLRERPRGLRWEYVMREKDWLVNIINPSKWIGLLDGAMDEDGARTADRIPPYYHEGHPQQQGPRISQALSMHVQCAKDWLAAGKEYWLGGEANGAAYPQGVQRIG